jgi:hypothetical protein
MYPPVHFQETILMNLMVMDIWRTAATTVFCTVAMEENTAVQKVRSATQTQQIRLFAECKLLMPQLLLDGLTIQQHIR